jgi:hypothetical protein
MIEDARWNEKIENIEKVKIKYQKKQIPCAAAVDLSYPFFCLFSRLLNKNNKFPIFLFLLLLS